MPLTTIRRKFGIEPRDLDLVIASPGKFTVKEKTELNAIFSKKKAANSRRPSVVALREQFALLAPRSKK